MSQLPLISIIVPVYNAEKTIIETLSSIKNQKFENFEVLVINDGSTDSSLSLLKEFSLSDPRFKIITKENAGASEARNTGLEQASGEWICFIDADDLISEDYLYSLYKSSVNADMVISNSISEFSNNINNCLNSWDVTPFMSEIPLQYILSHKVGAYVWGKLYKHYFIKKFNLSFNNSLTIGEDFDFNVRFGSYITSIEFSQAKYYYRISNESLSNKFSSSLVIERLKSAEHIYTFLINSNVSEKLAKLTYIEYGIFGCFRYILKNKQYSSILSLVKSIKVDFLKFSYVKSMRKKWIIIYLFIYLLSIVIK